MKTLITLALFVASTACGQAKRDGTPPAKDLGKWTCPDADVTLVRCVPGEKETESGWYWNNARGEIMKTPPVCVTIRDGHVGTSPNNPSVDAAAPGGLTVSKGETIWPTIISVSVVAPGASGVYEYFVDKPPRLLSLKETMEFYDKFLREDAEKLEAKDAEIGRLKRQLARRKIPLVSGKGS